MKIILASKSPRRRELLGQLYSEFDVITAETDETLDGSVHPSRGVEMLAVRKGAPVALDNPDALVISSDTLVELDGSPLGKPESTSHAIEMLRALSGRTHNVHTGVAVHLHGRVYSATATTAVRFKELCENEIAEYVASGEPMDKAGAYGIQGLGGRFVVGYDGDYDTVVGLSMRTLKKLIDEAFADE